MRLLFSRPQLNQPRNATIPVRARSDKPLSSPSPAVDSLLDRPATKKATSLTLQSVNMMKSRQENWESTENHLILTTKFRMACAHNHQTTVLSILQYDEKFLFTKDEHGRTPLFYVTDAELMKELLTYAANKGMLRLLLSVTDDEGLSVFDRACLNRERDLFITILEFPGVKAFLDLRYTLFYLRRLYASKPKHRSAYDWFSNYVRSVIKYEEICYKPIEGLRIPVFTSNQLQLAHYRLFNELPAIGKLSKEAALKLAWTQIFLLFQNPTECAPLLHKLEQSLNEYILLKHGPAFQLIEDDSYYPVSIQGSRWPVPKKSYVSLPTHSVLQEVLMAELQAVGLGQRAVKLSGFVPKEDADKYFSAGYLVTEDRLTGGIWHGKYAHPLGFYLVIEAIKQKLISLDYYLDNQAHQLTPAEIINASINLKTKEGFSLFLVVFDQTNDLAGFRAPHQLCSSIMCEGKAWGVPTLSKILTKSFINGILKLQQVFEQEGCTHPQEILTFMQNLSEYGNFNLPPQIQEATLKRAQSKASNGFFSKEFVISGKVFKPHPDFKP